MFAFLLYLPLWLVGTLASYPLVPIAVMFADREGRLPRIFAWLETPDALGWSGGLYEPAVRATNEKWGREAGLIHWLWRNKAYGLREWMRADVGTQGTLKWERGSRGVSPAFGFFYWYGRIEGSKGSWFELSPGFAFGSFYIFLRIGWKLRPYFDGVDVTKNTSAGLYTGITPRTDDWDDYRSAK